MVATKQFTTTQRGLGYAHQKRRRELLAELKDGQPCARCASRGIFHPLYRSLPPSMIEVDDFPPRSIARVLGVEPVKALSYKRCNRAHGARMTAAINRARSGQRRAYTRW